MKRVSTARARAQFSSLLDDVCYRGEQVIIERRGRPLAALVSTADLEKVSEGRPTSSRPRGALALVGAWSNIGDRKIDALVKAIYAARRRDRGRRVELEL